MKVKEILELFLFLIDLTDNSLFKIVIATTYICIYEINDSNERDRRDELEIFCYFKVPTLPIKQYRAIESRLELNINVNYKCKLLGNHFKK